MKVTIQSVFSVLPILLSLSCQEPSRSPLEEESRVGDQLSLRLKAFDPQSVDALLKAAPALSKRPNIFLIMIDTLRRDYVTPELAPTLYPLQQENFSFETTLAGGIATHHSCFATFYSWPAYDREPVFRSLWDKGSPALTILKQAGYKIHLFRGPLIIDQDAFG